MYLHIAAMSLPTKNYVKGPSTEETPLLLESVPLPIECDTKFYILQKRVYILVFLIIMLVQIGEFIQAAPSSKVLEEIICRNYFTATSNATGSQTFFDAGEGKRCKSKAVQSELAMLRGWTMTIDYLPGESQALEILMPHADISLRRHICSYSVWIHGR